MNGMRKLDSRVRRTELLLHRSLAALIHEKGYASIVVKEILARANVARSTFYAHFDSKEELLTGSILHMLADARDRLPHSSNSVERLLYFSLPVLQHIETQFEQSHANGRRHGHRHVHECLENVLAANVETDIRRVQPDGAKPVIPPQLLARHLATTFIGVVDWWLSQEPPPSAREAHDLYRALVEPVLAMNRCA